jgi:hypothetical protein
MLENERLNGELIRLNEVYGGRIRELEGRVEEEVRNFDGMVGQYNNEFQKFKKEGQEYVENLQFEYERKVKGLEEKNKTLENVKKVQYT